MGQNGKGDKRRPGQGYNESYERIFGNKKAQSGIFVPGKDGKVVQVAERSAVDGKIHVIEDIQPFKSPITGEIIKTRSQLREHHKAHGTTDSRDYSPEFMAKRSHEREQKMMGLTKQDKADRIDRLRYAMDKHRDGR